MAINLINFCLKILTWPEIKDRFHLVSVSTINLTIIQLIQLNQRYKITSIFHVRQFQISSFQSLNIEMYVTQNCNKYCHTFFLFQKGNTSIVCNVNNLHRYRMLRNASFYMTYRQIFRVV